METRKLIDGAETNITKTSWGNRNSVGSSLLVPVTAKENGVRFSCDTFLTPTLYNNLLDGYLAKATNIPDYKYTWTSPPISISCKHVINVRYFQKFKITKIETVSRCAKCNCNRNLYCAFSREANHLRHNWYQISFSTKGSPNNVQSDY